MKLAWITGARGFIGRHLAHGLSGKGYQVAGIGHGAWTNSEAMCWGVSHWFNGEITASNLVQLRQATALPQVIFHLAGGSSVGAAIANPHEDFCRTVVGSAELLEWMRQSSTRTSLVAISSAAVYGSIHPTPIAEDARLSPFSPYGSHKLMMETLCRSYASNFGLKVILPRLFSVFGPGLKKQLLWDLCEKLAAGGPVRLSGTGNELRDWIDVRSVVPWLEIVAKHASEDAPAINLATGRGISVRKIAELVIAAWARAGREAPPLNFSGQMRAGDPVSLVADVRKMHALGLSETATMEEALAAYVDWYLGRSEVCS